MNVKQPYRFTIIQENGEVLTGGAESKALAIEHLRHCLLCDPSLVCWYTGKHGKAARPTRIRRPR